MLRRYLSSLPVGKQVLWCYLLWYLGCVLQYFDPTPAIWLNSLGISALIGTALILSVGGFRVALVSRWQTFRLFAMPFCVSSFSSLIKGRGFILVLPPSLTELLLPLGLCLGFLLLTALLRRAG